MRWWRRSCVTSRPRTCALCSPSTTRGIDLRHRPAGPIRIATDLFLTPSTLQLLLTFVVADDRCPCGSRGLHQAELLKLFEGWPERVAWR